MGLENLIEMSVRYGSDPELVLAGGGNTSMKENGVLYVKCSGARLGNITEQGFVAMDIYKLREMMEKVYPKEDTEREAAFLQDVLEARCDADKQKRPSVEALLHSIFPQKYVLHVHPALVNGLTCSSEGKRAAEELLGDRMIWIPICRPGYTLGKNCWEAMKKYREEKGKEAQVLLLQNHGVFVAGNSVEEIDDIFSELMERLTAYIKSAGMKEIERELEAQLDMEAEYLPIREAAYFVESPEHAEALLKPFTPDHIVYCGAFPLYLKKTEQIEENLKEFKQKHKGTPQVILLEGVGAFAVGNTPGDRKNTGLLLADAMKIAYYAERFGGKQPMTEEMITFITNWEAETYRKKQGKENT